MRVAVVGAGLSGLTCARLLSQKQTVQVLEKASRVAGRITTSRLLGGGTSVLVDSGAQQLHWATAQPPAGLTEVRGGHPTCFQSPEGLSSVAERMAAEACTAGVSLHCDTVVSGLRLRLSDGGSTQWEVLGERDYALQQQQQQQASSSGQRRKTPTGPADVQQESVLHTADAVVLTQPAPQVLQLRGDTLSVLRAVGLDAPLSKVKYRHIFALMMAWQQDASLAAFAADGSSKCNPDIISGAYNQSAKIVQPQASGSSVVALSGPGLERDFPARSTNMAAVQQKMLREIQRCYPNVSPPSVMRLKRWRYATPTQCLDVSGLAAARAAGQVVRVGDSGAVLIQSVPVPGMSGVCYPPLVIAGDYTAVPADCATAGGAVLSGTTAAELLLQAK